jgi:hypothetical protein
MAAVLRECKDQNETEGVDDEDFLTGASGHVGTVVVSELPGADYTVIGSACSDKEAELLVQAGNCSPFWAIFLFRLSVPTVGKPQIQQTLFGLSSNET